MQRKPSNARRLIVPLVLAVTVVASAASVVSGCGTDKPKIDASVGDSGIDTPVV